MEKLQVGSVPTPGLLARLNQLRSKLMGSKTGSDFALAFGAHLFFKLAGYTVLMLLARSLSKDDMGAFFFLTTLATFSVILTDLGTSTYLLREVADQPQQALQHAGEVAALRLALVVPFLLLFNGFIAITRPALVLAGLLVSLAIFCEQYYQTFSSLFFGLRRASYNAQAGSVAKLLLVAAVAAVAALGASLERALAAYLVANAVLVAVAFWLVRTRIGALRLVFSFNRFRQTLRLAFPFLLTSLLGLAHYNLDVLLLGFLASYAAVASYGAGFKLLEASRFLIRPVVQVFQPLCSAMVLQQNWLGLRALLGKMLLVTASVGGAFALLIWFTAEPIMAAVFGASYTDAATVLRVLFLSIPPMYMATASTLLGNALHLEQQIARTMTLGVAAHVLLAVAGIWLMGALGAAWATLAAELLIASGLIVLNLRALRTRCAGLLPVLAEN